MFSGCESRQSRMYSQPEELTRTRELKPAKNVRYAQRSFRGSGRHREVLLMNGRTKHRARREVASVLANVDTDYNSVYWGYVLFYFEDLPGVVVSITPCMQKDQYGLLVAITNLYSDDIWFNGSAVALDEDGNQIGENLYR